MLLESVHGCVGDPSPGLPGSIELFPSREAELTRAIGA
jgi:hypothetical protein